VEIKEKGRSRLKIKGEMKRKEYENSKKKMEDNFFILFRHDNR
jgi:hypothetical protein